MFTSNAGDRPAYAVSISPTRDIAPPSWNATAYERGEVIRSTWSTIAATAGSVSSSSSTDFQ
jgi:hypothetical protein